MKDSSFILAIIIIATVVAFVFSSPQSISTSELPYRYEVDVISSMENGTYAVRLSTTLSVGENIPVRGNQIEISYFILSDDSNIDFFFRDEGGDGQWQIFTFSVDGRRDVGIIWESDNILVGESIFLPTGEKVTLLGLDSEGNPLFEVFE